MPPACSADGKTVYAADWRGPIYTSTNGGNAWTVIASAGTNWKSIACSADGARVAAITNSDSPSLFVSTNFGTMWRPVSLLPGYVHTVAMSADASKLVVSGDLGFLVSDDFGATWTNYPGPDYMFWVKCSADGSRLIMQAQGPRSPIYFSTNSGASWLAADVYNDYPEGVGISADGSVMIAATYTPNLGGPVFVSRDSGANWDEADVPWDYWSSVCSSADGRILAANGYHTYISSDFGRTWTLTELYTGWVTYLASSADGCRLFAAAATKGIYVYETVPHPVLSITQTGSTIQLSWLVPSRPFVLQQSPTLPEDWSDVLVAPTLNFTNLHHEIALPAPPERMFFRLTARE